MLFLVISNPRAESPSSVKSSREAFWSWMQPMLDSGVALSMYARVGRGGVAIFDVESNLVLHRIVSEWAEIMPAQFDIYPLVDSSSAQAYLQVHASGSE